MSDEDLLIALSEGDNSALDELFSRHGGRVLNYCAKRGVSYEQAQDVAQIVFLQIFRKKHLYDSKYPALAWLYIITQSELKDWRKKERRHAENLGENLVDLSQIEGVDPIDIEDEEQVQTLLSELSPKEQEALKLRYLDELEYSEIAARLNHSESNTRQIVSRALKFLKLKHGSKS